MFKSDDKKPVGFSLGMVNILVSLVPLIPLYFNCGSEYPT
jgi:hypothetical protein